MSPSKHPPCLARGGTRAWASWCRRRDTRPPPAGARRGRGSTPASGTPLGRTPPPDKPTPVNISTSNRNILPRHLEWAHMDYGKSLSSVQPSGTNCCEVYSVAYKKNHPGWARRGGLCGCHFYGKKLKRGWEKEERKKEKKRENRT